MSQADAPPADWYDDPSGRFQYRYWDGETWTGHVSTDGQTDWDPPGEGGDEGHADAGIGDAAADAESADAQAGSSAEEAVSGGLHAEDGAHDDVDAPSQDAADAATTTDEARWAPSDAAAEVEGHGQGGGPGGDAVDVGAAHDGAADDDHAGDDHDGDDHDGDGAAAEVAEAADAEVAETPAGGVLEPDDPADTNLVANRRAGLDADVEAWLDEVAAQVEPRLSRIERGWAGQPQAEAARACAYGLLIGHLAQRHPHMRQELSAVAEAHPSFTTIEEGARLETLQGIAQDPQRTAAWLGPLVGNEDVDRVALLFD